MSWLSNAFNKVKSVAKMAISVVASVALPLVSSVVGAIPVIGGIASKITDSLGNKLIQGFSGSNDEADAASAVNNYVSAVVVNNDNAAVSKPGVEASPPTSSQERGFLGIGDGKAGVFGVGTGRAKARKAAEDAAKQAGRTAAEIKAAGDVAVTAFDADGGTPSGGTPAPSNGGLIAVLAAAAAALLLL